MRAFLREVAAHPLPHGRGFVTKPRASASGQRWLSSFSLLFLLVLAAATAMAADSGRIVYTKVFPGSTPAYASITIDRSGAATYKEAADDDDPEKFQIEDAATKQIFDLADRLDHFKRPLESGLKVANMGMKTFHWDDGAAGTEAKFNHTNDENATAMQDWFERIAECERLALDLRRAIRHDKLGVNQAVINVQAEWDRKRLIGSTQFLPLLDQVAKNETYIHMARERAAQLVDAIRASDKSTVQ